MHRMTALIAGTVLAASNVVTAAPINFTGEIDYHNDVIYTYFTLNTDANDVRVWTDSFQSGTNFDPITALWQADGTLIDENDDNDSINPATQTRFDSGFSLASLSAGDYIFTVATYANFANGGMLSNGFSYDGETPIALESWDQPANDIDMGPFWSVWLDGVSSASNPNDPSDPSNPVPEPGTLALISLGLLGLSVRKTRKV
ncbi:DVUA0089 family protein [Marinobacter sp. F4218]|uniref:DVUA0089 family protein n=1 Tax=Marinobacter sp. F4218 TaxID=2862868 RepID=UPI001E50C556|nr:DVUA0089 family protein [Marinobacter sp. F4218]